jgi:transcriptional regulator with XRE-family HTH domain
VGEEPFGRWIQTVRHTARLAVSDIAAAMGKEPSYVDRLESGSTCPWDLDPQDIAHLVCLFRVHMKATLFLIQKSFDVSCAQLSGDVTARAHRGKMTRERGDSTRRALDMFLARNAKPKKLDDSITEWLSKVQKQLEDWQAKELID